MSLALLHTDRKRDAWAKSQVNAERVGVAGLYAGGGHVEHPIVTGPAEGNARDIIGAGFVHVANLYGVCLSARLTIAILGDKRSGIVHAASRGRPPIFAGARLVAQIEFGDAAAEVDASVILAGIELKGLVEIS